MKEVVIRNRDASLLCKRVAVSFIVFEADDIVTVVGAPSALFSCAEQCSNYCPVADINPITGYVHPPPPIVLATTHNSISFGALGIIMLNFRFQLKRIKMAAECGHAVDY